MYNKCDFFIKENIEDSLYLAIYIIKNGFYIN